MGGASRVGLKRWVLVWALVGVWVVWGLTPGTARSSSGPREAPHAPGRVIVSLKDDVTPAERSAVGSLVGLRSSTTLRLINAEVWEVDALSVSDAVAALSQDPRVGYAEPDYIVSVVDIPDDPMFDRLWGLHNSGQTGGTPGADIDAVRAWDISSDAQNVVIAVIDTGVDYNHPDLSANIWTNPGEVPGDGLDNDGNGFVDDLHGYDFYDFDGDPLDDNRHGTHCAGTIAAVGNNTTGVAGVAWTAKIMALKFLGPDGAGSVSRAVLALEYAAQMNARIASNSWGGSAFSLAMESAIGAAYDAGMLFVAAAGNSGLNNDFIPFYPASYDVPSVISVAATDHNDRLAAFSNYGAASVDLGAPGENVFSTVPGGYEYLSGTSMAAPHVSGAAALVWGRFPAMPVDDVKALILASADPLPSLAGKCLSGGRLNAFGCISEPDTIAPAAITDLVADNPASNTVDLAWTATGDDGSSGRATSYDLRFSTSPMDESNFQEATRAGAPRPSASGTHEVVTVAGLDFSTTYYFALRAADEYGNLSEVSNLASATTLGVPHIAVEPSSLEESLLTGAASSQTVVVRNAGEGTLDILASPPTLVIGSDAFTTDPWGYRWIDSDQAGGPAFEWVDITEVGTPVPVWGDDENSGPYPIGFDFEFYGNTFDHFRVCTNGFLSFTSTSTAYYNRPLPSADAPENLVAPLWKDLFVPAQNIFYHYDGSRLIVEWFEITPLGSDQICTFEAILYPSGEIIYQYLSTESPTYYGTVGIQNAARDDGLLVTYNAPYLHGGLAVLITRIPIWVSVSPSWARVYASESVGLSVQFDATALAAGAYSADLVIESNDPSEPALTVPIGLHVVGGPDISVSPASLDFGGVFIGNTAGLDVMIGNPGDEALEVTGLDLDNPDYAADPGVCVIEPRTICAVAVRFAPSSDGVSAGALSVSCSDPDEPVVEIPVHGLGVLPPDVSVSPDSLSAGLVTGGASSQALTIANQGFNDLVFDVSMSMGPAPGSVEEAIRERHRANILSPALPAYPGEARQIDASCRDGERIGGIAEDEGLAAAPVSLGWEEGSQGVNSWMILSPLSQARAQYGLATSPDGKIFALGGYAGREVTTTEIYDPAADLWRTGAPIPAPDRGIACAADSDGHVYYFGATQGKSYRYDPDADTWTPITPPPFNYLWGAAAARGADGRVYVIGGEGLQSEDPLNLVQIYDPGSGAWALGSPMPSRRYHLALVTVPGGFIYAVGGRASSLGPPLATVEVYDPETNTWSSAPPMPTARNQFGLAATADGRIYAIGGKYSYFNNEGPFFDVVEVYDPLAGAWETGPALSGPRGELGVALSGSTIYAAGGTGGAFVSLNEALARLNWLNVSPSSGSVAPSGGAHLDVAMDAAGLAGGDYFADITIATNDPDEIAVAVPVRLSVAGAPDVAVSARNLDFGRVYLGFEESQSLRIRNAGAQALEVAGIVVDDGDYSVSESAFILEPLASKDLSVRFAPSRLGLAPATLTVLSNDPLDPALIVSMSSEGRLAPKISLSPDSLAEAVAPGASRACTLTIANGGGSDLAFEIEMSERAAVAALGTTTLFSDDFEDGDLDGWFDTGGLGVKEVTDETAAVGTYSYHEYDSPGGHFTGIYQVFSPIQPGYIGFYVRAGSTTASAAYVVFLDGGGSDLIWFFARRTGFFYINADVDGDESFAYAVNIWYHVEFKEVDFAAKTFDYYVDGVLIKAGIPFRNRETVSAVGRLDLYNLDHGSEAWWDEINLAADQPPGWVSASPTEGVIAAGGSLDVSVTFDAGDLPVGTYEADLIVRSNDPRWPEAVVPVDLSISDRAEILVEPDSLRAVSPAGKARILGLKLGNAGIADLGFSVVPVDPAHSSEPPQWIAVTPSEGIVPGGGYADLRVRADARGLDVGLHEASLMIISNDQVRPVIYVGISLSVVSASPKPHDDSTPPDSSGDHAGVTDWVPTEFALSQSRPNPFSRSTAIVFDLPVGAGVTLDIYDVRGTRIATLVDDVLAAGRYSVTWSGQDESGADASPGVYFYRIRAGRWTQTRSALLIR